MARHLNRMLSETIMEEHKMSHVNKISMTKHLAYIGAAIIISSAGFYADIYIQELNFNQVTLAMTNSVQTLILR